MMESLPSTSAGTSKATSVAYKRDVGMMESLPSTSTSAGTSGSTSFLNEQDEDTMASFPSTSAGTPGTTSVVKKRDANMMESLPFTNAGTFGSTSFLNEQDEDTMESFPSSSVGTSGSSSFLNEQDEDTMESFPSTSSGTSGSSSFLNEQDEDMMESFLSTSVSTSGATSFFNDNERSNVVRLQVWGVPDSMSTAELEELFSQCGAPTVEKIESSKDVYIEYKSMSEAQSAIEKFDNQEPYNFKVIVSQTRPENVPSSQIAIVQDESQLTVVNLDNPNPYYSEVVVGQNNLQARPVSPPFNFRATATGNEEETRRSSTRSRQSSSSSAPGQQSNNSQPDSNRTLPKIRLSLRKRIQPGMVKVVSTSSWTVRSRRYWVTLQEDLSTLEELNHELGQRITDDSPILKNPQVDDFCCNNFHGIWCRARIRSLEPLVLLYIDYGIKDVTSTFEDLKELPEDVAYRSPLAIRVRHTTKVPRVSDHEFFVLRFLHEENGGRWIVEYPTKIGSF